MTYAKASDLKNYTNIISQNLECAKFYSAELLIAMENCHKHNIIHRDLKPQNIFLSSQLHILLGDFGSSKILQDEEQAKDNNNSDADTNQTRNKVDRRASFVGTALYVSPEVLKGKRSSFASDLFSFGCIIFELCSGRPPFGSSGENEYTIFQQIQKSEYKFPENFNAQAKDLVSKLLRTDPDQRIGSQDTKDELYQSIRNHEFFSNVNFDKIYSQASPLLILTDLKKEMIATNDFIQDDTDIQPGLDEQQMKRIIELELNFSSFASSSSNKQLYKL